MIKISFQPLGYAFLLHRKMFDAVAEKKEKKPSGRFAGSQFPVCLPLCPVLTQSDSEVVFFFFLAWPENGNILDETCT